MKISLTSFICFFHFISFSQWNEDFNQLTWNTQTEWQGDTAHYEIKNDQLHLQAPAVSSSSYIVKESLVAINASWEFSFVFEENPSSSNEARIFLTSSQSQLIDSTTGYFVHIGGTSDEINLYRQDGNSSIEIIDGLDGWVDMKPVEVTIKVTKDTLNQWTLWTKYSEGNEYFLQGSCIDSTYQTSSYFGIICEYTSTRSNKFWFDNISITGQKWVDQIPPTLINHEFIDDQIIQLTFSEYIDVSTSNCSINDPSIFCTIEPNKSNNTQVFLNLNHALNNGQHYTFTLEGIKDLAQNEWIDNQFTLYHYQAQLHDIIMTEVMVDPTPSILLPEYEYIELYNTQSFPIHLANWYLKNGSKNSIIPSITIPALSYIVLVDSNNISFYNDFNNVYGIVDLPTLTNSSDHITLFNEYGLTIHDLHYSLDWYQNQQKQDGGWSLEMKDLSKPCLGEINWMASSGFKGGTPGMKNSVYSFLKDIPKPTLIHTYPLSKDEVTLHFDQFIDSNLLNVNTYQWNSDQPNILTMSLQTSLQEDIITSISISNINNCTGSSLDTTFDIALATLAQPKDIVINEIMVSPFTGGNDYVEIFNSTDQYIDLSNLYFCKIENGELQETISFVSEPRMIEPQTWLVLTKNRAKIINQYQVEKPHQIIEVSNLPDLPTTKGHFAIVNQQGIIIDELAYLSDWHYGLYTSTKGVALERIDPYGDTQNLHNWHSASLASGLGTPTSQNSQFSISPISPTIVTISPESFSPNGDSFDDITTLIISPDQQSYSASVTIYNTSGVLVHQLVQNSPLGSLNKFKWDGLNMYHEQLPQGIYIFYIELINTNGNIASYKSTVVLERE